MDNRGPLFLFKKKFKIKFVIPDTGDSELHLRLNSFKIRFKYISLKIEGE